jgi:hypothetical protein
MARGKTRTVVPTPNDIQRFWSKVCIDVEDDCWIWTGHTETNGGYGRFYIQGGFMIASRVAYIIGHQKQIPEGQLVCHSCDNPSCMNPKHMFLSDDAGNSLDRDRKNRTAQQELNTNQVLEIYRRIDNGESYSRIAKDYPVGYNGIYRIAKGMTWKFLYKDWKGSGRND